MELKVNYLKNLSWFPFSDEPVVKGGFYLPQLSNPQILLPEESCDSKWHLFVHSWLGLHHFISDSGIAWEPKNLIEVRAHSPFIYRENENYYLLYEKHDKKIPFIGMKHSYRENEKDTSTSSIDMCSSTDLITWSKPRTLITSKDVSFADDYLLSPRISRPQLCKIGRKYRLYFGASHIVLPDSKQKVSRYLSYAECDIIDGLYECNEKTPLLRPTGDDEFCNLGVGSFRLLPLQDGFAAFTCPATWNSEKNRSETNLFLMFSEDGLKWERQEKPILVPAERGWASRYIMGCDVHYKEKEDCWYCYFCANGNKRFKIKQESIGLLIGNTPELRGAPKKLSYQN